MSRPSLSKIGESAFNRSDHISVELFALTYGSIVRQLFEDYEETEAVNEQLDKMGYNIGVRLIDDFLSKSKIHNCGGFIETAEAVSKVAFRMYLGIQANASDWSSDRNSFSLLFQDNPLTEFVELPANRKNLWYCNVICGILRGALEMIQMVVECKYARCTLRGDNINEIRITLREILRDQPPMEED